MTIYTLKNVQLTDAQLDGLMYRADTCPATLTWDELDAAKLVYEQCGRPLPKSLILEYVARKLLGVSRDAA